MCFYLWKKLSYLKVEYDAFDEIELAIKFGDRNQMYKS